MRLISPIVHGFGLAAAICLATSGTASGVDISTAAADRAQRFEAWGTSLAWWANGVGGWTDGASRDELLDLMFDQDNGLGLNYARYNVGGGQNRLLAGNFRPGALVPGWVPTAPTDVQDSTTWQWNWDADPNQRRVLDAVLDRGVHRVDAISYSAPFWMTNSQDTAGGVGGASNLPQANVPALAEYQAEVVRHFYENLDVRFQAYSPMNEPSANYWVAGGQQEGMRVAPGFDQRLLLEATGNALLAKGLPVGIAAAEEFATGLTNSSFSQYNDYTKSFITQINTHVYGGAGSNPESALTSVRNLAANEGVRLYQSEYGNNSTTGLLGGIGLASRITQDVNQMGVEGWAYWQVVEPNELSGAGWGLAWAGYDPNDSGYTVRKQYHVMRQFSGHIRPGSHILQTTDAGTVAAFDPNTETTVLVFTNDGADAAQRQYTLTDGAPAFTREIRTDTLGDYVSLGSASVTGSQVSLNTSGPSVSTLVLHGQPNLVGDAGFDATAGDATGAGAWSAAGDAAFLDSGFTPHVAELQTDNPGNAGAIWQEGVGDGVTDLSGEGFQFSVDAYFQQASGSVYEANTRLAVEFYGADGQTLTHGGADDYATSIEPSADDSAWRVYRTPTVIAPEGTRFVRPVVRFDSVDFTSNDTVLIDNAYLQQTHYQPRGRRWSAEGGGVLAEDANWDFDARRSENGVLVFGDAINQPATVTLQADTSATSVAFDSPQPYRLLGAGRLSLGDASHSGPTLDARRGTHQVTVDIQLEEDATVRVLDGAVLNLGQVDADGHLLRKVGPGQVNFSGGLDLGGGALELFAAPDAGVLLGGSSVLDGDLKVRLAPGQAVALGDVFELVAFSGTISHFAGIDLPELAPGLGWSVAYGSSTLDAQVVLARLPGDYNDDGVVDGADYSLWRDSSGQSVDPSTGADGNGDGLVDQADYDLWRDNYGATGPSTAQTVPVPEALSSAIALAGILGIMIHGDRHVSE